MLHEYLDPMMSHPLFFPVYLGLGLVMGLIILKLWGPGESPVGTLIMFTIMWGPCLLILGPIVVAWLVFAGICAFCGLSPDEGDSHGC
jgi:hypothetical protein